MGDGLSVPATLVKSVAEFRGGMGQEWLERLPHTVAACRARWALRLGPPFSYPSLSYVAPALLPDGTQVVLKVGFLYDELASEAQALRHFGGHGAVRLLAAEPEQGALLLERLRPGTMLVEVKDPEEATAVAASVMRELWRPPPPEHGFPTVAGWVEDLQGLRRMFGGGTGPLPAAMVELAEGLGRELLASAPEPMLLHGDLQHFNVLRAERRPWLAIDPKGVVGDPGYEVGAYLGNEWKDAPDPARLQARRLFQLSEVLGIDRERLRCWGVVQAVLSAWWSVEDQGRFWEGATRNAEILAGLP